MSRINRRQLLAGGATLGAFLAMPAIGRAQPGDQVRIGVAAPASSGLVPVRASLYQYIGDAARQGALMAEGPVSEEAAAAGVRLVLGMANTPTPEAAQRAGERFVTAGIDAIVGGVGDGQAEVLSALAEEAGVPFFNIGSSEIALRQACRRFTFHVEPSAAMYLDAMVAWGALQGYRRWFVVHEDTAEGEALSRRAVDAVARHGDGGESVGAASAQANESFYGPQLQAAETAGADAIILALNEIDQVVFVAQQESVRVTIPVIPFPLANAQTRDYIVSYRSAAPETAPDFRIAPWEATLASPEAEAFNTRYITRWGAPAEPPAWSAYHAIKIISEAVIATGSVDGDALVDYLENSGAEFDLLKGPGVSFRQWDHQLRQPLYVIRVNHESEWQYNVPTTHVAVADFEQELPAPGAGGDPIARLDAFGDDARAASCFVHEAESEH